MNASSESGLCATVISRMAAGVAASDCLVLTECLSTKSGHWGLKQTAMAPAQPSGSQGRGCDDLERIAGKKWNHRLHQHVSGGSMRQHPQPDRTDAQDEEIAGGSADQRGQESTAAALVEHGNEHGGKRIRQQIAGRGSEEMSQPRRASWPGSEHRKPQCAFSQIGKKRRPSQARGEKEPDEQYREGLQRK